MNGTNHVESRERRPVARRHFAGLAVGALALAVGSASPVLAGPAASAVSVPTVHVASAAIGSGSHHHRGHYGHRHHTGHRYYGSIHFGFPYLFGFGYYHGGYPYAYGHPYRYGRYVVGGEPMGGIDINVKPKRAEVFVDGSPVGTARQFDGFPSFLWLEKGTYDVVLYLDGYETLNRQISVYPGVVVDFDGRMVPGSSVRPEDIGPTSTKNRDERIKRNRERAEAAERRAPSASGEEPGRIAFSVWPADAVVYLDGHFLGAADELAHLSAGLIVDPGRHTVEVVRPGYRSVRREVDVATGERLDLDIELDER